MKGVQYALLALGFLVAVAGTRGLDTPLASMASYTAALMALNQIAPPLLLLGLPASVWPRLRASAPGGFLLDPWVAAAGFLAVTLVIGLPGWFDRAVANAAFGAPLGLLELTSGLLVWAQILPASAALPAWRAGLYGWLLGLPMMALGLVWIWSGRVLYTPYLDVICVWNIPPLADQRWAGFVMLIAGLPLQLASVWRLLAPLTDTLP